MTKEEKMLTQREFEALKKALTERGIAFEEHNPFILFSGPFGQCMVFPSQTYDDKLVVKYEVKKHVNTAIDVLHACGIDSDE